MADDASRNSGGRFLFVIAVLLFLALGAIFLPHYLYRLNTDATAYVTVARLYLAGDYHAAINSYWGPLLSWLIAPLLALKLAPLTAARIANLAVGLATLCAIRSLGRQIGLSGRWASALALAMAAPLVGYALIILTPDLLLLLMLTLYAATVLPDSYRSSRWRGPAAGLFAGLAYLSKSYALPFFVAHFFAVNLLHWFRSRRRPPSPLRGEGRGEGGPQGAASLQSSAIAAYGDESPSHTQPIRGPRVCSNFLLGVLAFAMVAGAWIGMLHHKYGRWTAGSSSARTHAIVGPEIYPDDPLFNRLLPPPSDNGLSCWDDPSTIPAMPSWRPWESRDNMRHQWLLVRTNAMTVFWPIACFAPLGVVALAAFLVAPFRRRAARSIRRSAIPLLLTIALFAGGYLLVWAEMRYLWFVVLLLLAMGVMLIEQTFAAVALPRAAVALLVGWLVASCWLPALRELIARSDQGEDVYKLAILLREDYGLHGNIASNADWPKSLGIAFHLRARYYGQPDGTPADKLLDDLRSHGIDYYLIWDSDPRIPPNTPMRELTTGRIKGLRVYAVSESLTPTQPTTHP
ncbi:MAG: glycosyltransferase family 39 protein [Phycisphaerae bacterium]|nr:glycosyltransferase family 39 protein [Phycisphaerae bacterium]